MSEPAPSRRLHGAGVLEDPLVGELLAARLVAVLATLEPDGSIHAVAVWAVPIDGAIVIATGTRSRKVRNLVRDRRATIVLHDSRPGYEVCGASIRGLAEIVRGDAAQDLVARVHDHYVTSAGQVLPATSAFLASDDVAIVVRPETAITWDERASEAAEELRRRGGALALEPTSPRP